MSLLLVPLVYGKAYKDICVSFLGGKDEEYCCVQLTWDTCCSIQKRAIHGFTAVV